MYYNLPTPFVQPYFCGHDPRCTEHNSNWALDRAKENVERHFPVVAVLEMFEDSLKVMAQRDSTHN